MARATAIPSPCAKMISVGKRARNITGLKSRPVASNAPNSNSCPATHPTAYLFIYTTSIVCHLLKTSSWSRYCEFSKCHVSSSPNPNYQTITTLILIGNCTRICILKFLLHSQKQQEHSWSGCRIALKRAIAPVSTTFGAKKQMRVVTFNEIEEFWSRCFFNMQVQASLDRERKLWQLGSACRDVTTQFVQHRYVDILRKWRTWHCNSCFLLTHPQLYYLPGLCVCLVQCNKLSQEHTKGIHISQQW